MAEYSRDKIVLLVEKSDAWATKVRQDLCNEGLVVLRTRNMERAPLLSHKHSPDLVVFGPSSSAPADRGCIVMSVENQTQAGKKRINRQRLIDLVNDSLKRHALTDVTVETSLSDLDSVQDLAVGSVRLNRGSRLISIDGRQVRLTTMQAKLVSFLMRHPGRCFSSQDLLEKVWGYKVGIGNPGLVRWHINALRQKIELDPEQPIHVITNGRVGYYFAQAEEPIKSSAR